jgi:uncharacterized repeat protein (TIGR04044 family)
MPASAFGTQKNGDPPLDHEEKIFEDVKAGPGEKALVTFNTGSLEGSIGTVNLRQAIQLLRKGFETTVLLYGPGVALCVTHASPAAAAQALPDPQNLDSMIMKFLAEGGKVYACRFALQVLYSPEEPTLFAGVRAIHPLDVLDLILLHRKDNAFMVHSWTL